MTVRQELSSIKQNSGPISVAFMPPASTYTYFWPMKEGVNTVARSANATVIELAPPGGSDIHTQARLIQEAMDQNVSAIIICAHSDITTAPPLKRAMQAGIVVVIVNSDDGSLLNSSHAVVGYKQRLALQALGKYVSGLNLATRFKAALLEGLPGYHNRERMTGFRAGIEREKIDISTSIHGRWITDDANRATLDLLRTDPEINAIIALNDDMAIGASLAASSLGRQLLITGVDGQDQAFEAIIAGRMTATVDTQPYQMGQVAMQTVRGLISHTSSGGFIETPIQIRDSKNVGGARRSTSIGRPI